MNVDLHFLEGGLRASQFNADAFCLNGTIRRLSMFFPHLSLIISRRVFLACFYCLQTNVDMIERRIGSRLLMPHQICHRL